MVLAFVILNSGRMTQKSPSYQAMVRISSVSPIARELGAHPRFAPCLASSTRCMDVDAPAPQICLVSSGRCAATGKIELLNSFQFP